MACDITAPSRVIRSASHFGTWPPCSGRSALPARRAMTSSAALRIDKLLRSCFVLDRVSRGKARNGAANQSIRRPGSTGIAPRARARRMTAPYLAKLNAEQRHAVEHGGGSLEEASPLLIIAGAGSGKTSTLAHRVAHLVVCGADPRRIMLLTFSRRAAAE